jgi:hypothetical protein
VRNYRRHRGGSDGSGDGSSGESANLGEVQPVKPAVLIRPGTKFDVVEKKKSADGNWNIKLREKT